VSAMNLPNSLTVLRIFFVPLLVVVLLTRQPNFDFWGLPIHFEVWGVLILLMAAATDVMDGYIARKRGEITTLGILLDPIADKLLISAAFISLVQMGLVPAWMVVIIGQDENDFAGAGRLRCDSDGEVCFAEAARYRADVARGIERRCIGDSLFPDVLEPDR
jgi:CDP-diacylglycerol--glycerol-3-phosphate 3-phosphatidyltransferase